MPWLLLVSGLYAASWLFEILVGILFAMAAHTTLTRLRNRMFLNLVQQDIAFYDAHVSGELSSRLINDSGQLQGLAQFTTQQLLQAVPRPTKPAAPCLTKPAAPCIPMCSSTHPSVRQPCAPQRAAPVHPRRPCASPER